MEETISVRNRLIALCQEHAHVIEDYPFGESEWTVMRHEGTRKTFAYIYERNGEIWLNVKNTPERNDYLRETIPEIMPAYHMNKTHWITLRLVSEELYPIADRIITESYRLTQTKPRKKNNSTPKRGRALISSSSFWLICLLSSGNTASVVPIPLR